MTKSNLYEISVSDGVEMTWYAAEVKDDLGTYLFEINRTVDRIGVYLIDGSRRRLSIVNVDNILDRITNELDKHLYLKAIRTEDKVDWVLLDGINLERGMTEEEQKAFLYLKENILDKMATSLGMEEN